MCTCRRRCTDVYFHGENKRKTWQDSEKENEYKLVDICCGYLLKQLSLCRLKNGHWFSLLFIKYIIF